MTVDDFLVALRCNRDLRRAVREAARPLRPDPEPRLALAVRMLSESTSAARRSLEGARLELDQAIAAYHASEMLLRVLADELDGKRET